MYIRTQLKCCNGIHSLCTLFATACPPYIYLIIYYLENLFVCVLFCEFSVCTFAVCLLLLVMIMIIMVLFAVITVILFQSYINCYDYPCIYVYWGCVMFTCKIMSCHGSGYNTLSLHFGEGWRLFQTTWATASECKGLKGSLTRST